MQQEATTGSNWQQAIGSKQDMYCKVAHAARQRPGLPAAL
jgi:hypothetical protein